MVIEFFFHPISPPSQAVRMILHELDIEHNDHEIKISSAHKSAELLKVNPNGKVPAIRDGNFTLAESRAIAIYLCTKYEASEKPKKLYPCGEEERSKMNEALFADYDDYNYVGLYTNADEVFGGAGYGPVPKYIHLVKKFLKRMESNLEKHRFLFADHLTVLDCFTLSNVEVLNMANKEIFADYPRVQAWRKAMEALPYYDEYHAKPNAESAAYYKSVSDERRKSQDKA